MPVSDKLPCCPAGWGNAHPVYHIVEPCFDKLEKVLTCDAIFLSSFLERITELPFQDTVCIFGFLLFLQLNAILGFFPPAPVVTMMSRGIWFPVKGFVWSKDGIFEFPGNLRFWSSVPGHNILLLC